MIRNLAILIMLVSSNSVLACRCLPMTFEEEAESSNKIFHGRVISVDRYTFLLKVINTWKGDFTSDTIKLTQGQTSCETRTFELNKEYLFFLNGKSIFNCSRTNKYELNIDSELLDLKFKSIGNKKTIESNFLTEREVEILKSLFERNGVNIDSIGEKQVRFAIQDDWVDKWTMFRNQWLGDIEIKFVKLNNENDIETMMLWSGINWEKSIKRLKRKMKVIK